MWGIRLKNNFKSLCKDLQQICNLQGPPYILGRTLLISHALMTDILPISKLHSFATTQSFLLRYITSS